MVVSKQKLQNELNYMYDKIENYIMTMSGHKRLQKLLTAPVSSQIQYINYVEGLITKYRILEPAIADTALVSADMLFFGLS